MLYAGLPGPATEPITAKTPFVAADRHVARQREAPRGPAELRGEGLQPLDAAREEHEPVAAVVVLPREGLADAR